MRLRNHVQSLLTVLALTAAATLAHAAAPAVPGPERLPADTWLLVSWHGTAAADKVRDTNPVMRMWADPKFTDARNQIIESLIADGAVRNRPWSRADVDDYLALMENPMIVGLTGDPLAPGGAAGGQGMRMFAVLNKKGKEAVVERLDRKEPAPGAQQTSYEYRGVNVEKIVKTVTPAPQPGVLFQQPRVSQSFEASLGDYLLHTDNQQLMESLIARLQAPGPAAASMQGNEVFQQAQRFRADGAMLEIFVDVPDLSRLPLPVAPEMNLAHALRELHPERMHGLWLSAGMAQDRLLIRGALLGDMSPGSVLDVIGANAGELQTLAIAPAAGSYSGMRFDFTALYATLLRAARAALPPEQSGAASMLIDAVVASQTGLRMSELLGLFTGEIAVVSEGELAEQLPALMMFPITSREQVVALLRTFFGTIATADEQVAGADVMTIALPGNQGSNQPPIHLAVTSTMLLVSPDRSQLDAALARARSGSQAPAGSLAADPGFRATRSTLPAQINSLTYSDLSRPGWEQQFAALREQVKSLAGVGEVLDAVLPLLSTYFKTSAGAAWKSADGWYFHSFVN